MTALVRVLTDPARQADQRTVPAEGVADTELGHRQIEDRIPLLTGEGDEGDHERKGDDGSGDDHRGPWPASAPFAEPLVHAPEVHEGVTLTIDDQ